MPLGRPVLTVFAGPNGSGKSSLTRHLATVGYDFAEYINPDDIANVLSGEYEARVREAQLIADARRAEAITARRSFTFETVFSHPSKLDVLNQARRAGFETVLFFIGIDDPIINVERVKTRVQLGGHDVPSDRVVARYHRVMALLPEMIEHVDRAWIFDNTVRAPQASQFSGRLVADMYRQSTRDAALSVRLTSKAGNVVPIRPKTNDPTQAAVALLLMKQKLGEAHQYIDLSRDDEVFAHLMTMSRWITDKVIEAYLRGEYGYPTLQVITAILDELDDAGVRDIFVTLRYPLPAWVEHHLVTPLRERSAVVLR